MTLLTWWTWVWICSGSWWCTRKPGMLQSMRSQGVRYDSATELNWLMIKMTFFMLMLVLEVVVDFHRASQLQLLWHQWLGHRDELLWCWIIFLGNELISFCHFSGSTQVGYWTPSDLGNSPLVSYIFAFSHGVLLAKILQWVIISSSSGPGFVKTLHYDPSILHVPSQHGLYLHGVMKPLHHNKAIIHEGINSFRKHLHFLKQISINLIL